MMINPTPEFKGSEATIKDLWKVKKPGKRGTVHLASVFSCLFLRPSQIEDAPSPSEQRRMGIRMAQALPSFVSIE